MSYDNGDFDFAWGELTPREPMGREEFDDVYYRIVVNTGGVLTIRRKEHAETTVMALGPDEWSVAKECDK